MNGLSPRRRRLRWTLATLCAAFAISTLIGVAVYQRSRPAAYRPDEKPDDITNELARNLPPEAPRPRLTDVTREAGLGDFSNFSSDRTSQLPEDMGPGAAWGDFDNDGDDDLFLVSAGGSLSLPADQLLPCRLYENLGNGSFRAVQQFPELRIRGLAAAWGDYDGDGFLDLVVTGYNALRLYRNEGGSGRFSPDPRLPHLEGFWSGAAWGDFNNDRRLDLYVCNYVEYAADQSDRDKISDQIGTAVPFTLNPASYPGGRNALFRQCEDGTFIDVAEELNVQNREGRSLGALWHDFDQDGWLDLYVANDVSDNVFYRNVQGRFEDISHASWVADYRSAMGIAVGDFDRDGDDDMFVTHWVAQENALYENLWADHRRRAPAVPAMAVAREGVEPRAPHPPAAGPNKAVPLSFIDVADQRGLGHIGLPYVGWGAEFVDLDHDGWQDLLVANGNTLEEKGPLPKRLQPQESFLLWSQKGRFFHNLAPLHPGLSGKHVSRGLACADFDNDGDQDFIIADLGEGVRLFRNDMAAGNWLKVRLRSRNAAGQPLGFGDGSTVVAWLGNTPMRRAVTGVSYLSQSTRTLHWGLGAATRVDRLEVYWHAGGTNVYEALEANREYELHEGDNTVRLRPHIATTAAPAPASRSPGDEKQRLVQFWNTQRSAMNAMKVERDNLKAIGLFREAIALNPSHEDSRYYLGLCLASQDDAPGALAALEDLQRLNPQSHRGFQQWAVVRALFARNDEDLAAAEQALMRARAINPEETGALLLLGEVALLRGQHGLAEQRLAAATYTNPRAVGGFFLRAFLAWQQGEPAEAKALLEQARTALGPDWQPKGATSEGDVLTKQHVHNTPLAAYWESWDGNLQPDAAFRELTQRLDAVRNR